MQLLPLLRLSHSFLGARNGAGHPSERRGNPLVVGRHTLVLSKEPLLKISSSILNLMLMWAFMVARRGSPGDAGSSMNGPHIPSRGRP